MTNSLVFLDANTLVYALDKTSAQNSTTISIIQRLLDEGVTLCTSHHVIEEVLHIARKISHGTSKISEVVEEINKIPDLVLIEPDATIDFAKRYADLSEALHMGVNDALLLQLMLDAGITKLFSYDKKFLDSAKKLHIEQVS
jgi:predicted nucleic acid-binding protein